MGERSGGATKVHVHWTTKPEANIRYFVVERRLSNETGFSNRDSLLAAVKYVVIWNVQGQMIHRELVNDRNIIPMTMHLPGNYLVGFISHSGQVLETKELVVTGD